MMKKMTSLLLAVLLLMCLALPVGANSVSHIADDAGLLCINKSLEICTSAGNHNADFNLPYHKITPSSLFTISPKT